MLNVIVVIHCQASQLEVIRLRLGWNLSLRRTIFNLREIKIGN